MNAKLSSPIERPARAKQNTTSLLGRMKRTVEILSDIVAPTGETWSAEVHADNRERRAEARRRPRRAGPT